ncbi:BtrH N-terminal domain-containing protein [Xylanibacillus composti]|uniref:Butirosin biosynthesis protein H N-terminal domain-containing protein n=1 Tax=Xylanibacillus composti TaxID=1572762 RepID=A0A8J4M398_9BACL|nr:BtrH N-terminal domain-containing protein [Xylanibacillus composti]GIQ70594.1 hypothetical protein XYCOK13_34180 [Xylanibacillus composti]
MIDLNIQPRKNGGNCFDDVLDTVTHWYGKDFRMVHAEGLKFAFHPASPGKPTLGTRMQLDFQRAFALMETFHGLRMKLHRELSPQEAIRLMEEQLRDGHPVIFAQDDHYNPWSPNYGLRHDAQHMMIAIGIDPATKGLLCIDPFFEREKSTLAYDLFEQGFDRCITVQPVEPSVADNAAILARLRELVREELDQGMTAAGMRALAEALPGVDIEEETRGIATFGHCLLFVGMGALIMARRNYALMLRYLAERAAKPSLHGSADAFDQLVNRWTIIRGQLTKLYSQTRQGRKDGAAQDAITSDMAEKIIAASQAENVALEALHELLGKEDKLGEGEAATEAVDANALTVEQLIHVDLIPYLTARAIENHADTANIDGEGYYFSREPVPQGILHAADMSFAFPAHELDAYDSLLCEGQVIELSAGPCKGIMLLGCSTFGDYQSALTVEFDDQSALDLKFGFSDWWTYTPVDGEIIAWRSKARRRGTGELPTETNLYAKKIPFPAVRTPVRLRLPDLPNIHLFGITLWK